MGTSRRSTACGWANDILGTVLGHRLCQTGKLQLSMLTLVAARAKRCTHIHVQGKAMLADTALAAAFMQAWEGAITGTTHFHCVLLALMLVHALRLDACLTRCIAFCDWRTCGRSAECCSPVRRCLCFTVCNIVLACM